MVTVYTFLFNRERGLSQTIRLKDLQIVGTETVELGM